MKQYRKSKKRTRRGIIGIWLLMIVCIVCMLSSADFYKEGIHKYAIKSVISKRVIQTMAPMKAYENQEDTKQVLISYLYEKIGATLHRGNVQAQDTVDVAAVSENVQSAFRYETEIESELTYEQILEQEANDENEPTGTQEEQAVKENEQKKADEENEAAKKQEEEKEKEEQTANPEAVQTNVVLATTKSIEYPMEKLNDFDYLIQNFYLVDKTTTITGEQLNAQEMLNKDFRLAADVQGPQILIYHTHSQESYADHVEGDSNSTVVGMGNYLTELLTQRGFAVLHDTGAYDLEGRNTAYTRAAAAVETLLAANPSIEVVIDLHRDGVAETTHLTSETGGVTMAPVMFFNGLSRTTTTGDITYLPNPYIQDNLAFSFQLQLTAAQYYPGWTRPIYLKGYRYNMHYRPKSLLIEVGAQTNTTQEARNAMEPLADILDKVLRRN